MKNKNLPWLTWLVTAVAVVASTLARAGEAPTNHYETGYASVAKITSDLYRALDRKNRGTLLPSPVLLNNVHVPYVQPSEYFDGTNNWQAVHISSGFIQLLSALAHAKAIDENTPGYFQTYLASFAQEAGDKPFTPPPGLANPKSWSFDTMNHQVSGFNQMAGALIAIDLAHHYLGHQKKYAGQLVDPQSRAVPINALITPKEWHAAVMKGARNALDCGLGVDGLKTLFESIEKMKTRPAWTVYFLPPKAEVSKLNRDLAKMEKDFFLSAN